MWGGVQGANAGLDLREKVSVTYVDNNIPGRLDPAAMGGLKIGTWFVKEGFLGFNYPNWCKYLGFYLDFSYHRLNFRNQQGSWVHQTGPTGINIFFSEGTAATLAFMFAGRLGFLPDSEVPFGRLQPFVAVGPGILFASQQPSLSIPSMGVGQGASDSDAAICLAAEAGLRWMCLKNVSIAISFKYRYAEPRFNSSFFNPWEGKNDSMTFNPTFHLFSGQVGVAYYF